MKLSNEPADSNGNGSRAGFGIFVLFLLVVLLWLFHQSFDSNMVVFANDLPLGALKADAVKMPSAFFGIWHNLNWLGAAVPSASPNWTGFSATFWGPELFAKFYAASSIFLLGVCAWFYFRTLRFSPWVCIAGGLAAALNSNVFSNACWGQSSRPLSTAMCFLAFAFLHMQKGPFWLRALPAGFAVGMGVSEGFDVGAIFSLYVALYFVFYYLVSEKTVPQKVTKAVVSVGLMAVFASITAYQTIDTLFATQLKHAAILEQKSETPEEKRAKWDFATQWSLSKAETLRVIIPGVFGYRMSDRSGHIYPQSYWGKVGQTPGNLASRFNGSGEYAGVFVVLVAIYGLFNALKKGSNIGAVEKKCILFWSALAVISLLLAWGRFAPFYQFFYALPHADAIRNPMKFMHPFHLAVLVLFGYGLQALFRDFIERPVTPAAISSPDRKKWQMGLYAALGVSALGALIYSAMKKDLEKTLATYGFDPAQSHPAMLASYSITEVWIYLFVLAASIGLVTAIMNGWFSGARARTAGIIIALFLAIDLGRADKPWIIYWDAKQKYESNPILETLKEKAYDHRVIIFPFQIPQMQMLSQLYGIELLQQTFQYHNIQSLDVIQEPRASSDTMNYRRNFGSADRLVREWQLTNTRFFLGLNGQFISMINDQLDPALKRFKLHTAFKIVPKEGVMKAEKLEDLTMTPDPNGEYALIEFTGALPRAKLFSNWQISTNSDSTLKTLTEPAFDPFSSVIIEGDTAGIPAPAAGKTADAGTVTFESYAPKKIVLNANATAPSMLLLNDRDNPDWRVTIDGKPGTILRANYLMRAVYLPAGQHQVTFEFAPPVRAFYLSLGAVISGLALMGILMVWPKRKEEPVTPSAEVKS